MVERKPYAPGTGVATIAVISKASVNLKILNPDQMSSGALPVGTFGRVHSNNGVKATVWFLDEGNSRTVMAEIPYAMLGVLIKPYAHRIFPHLG